MEDLIKATLIDGIAATEDKDNQREILKLSGADISEMTEKGFFNADHRKGFENVLGRITKARKVMREEDALDEREKYFWNQVKRPYLYVKGYLFDDTDHPGAKAVTSIMKEFQKRGTPLDVKMSVEGKVVERDRMDNSTISSSKIRNVALTLAPANDFTGSTILTEENREAAIAKCEEVGGDTEYADALMKSLESEEGVENVWDDNAFESESSERDLENAIEEKLKNLTGILKAMTAGYGHEGAPSSRVGGAAQIKESLDQVLVAVQRAKKKVKSGKRARTKKAPKQRKKGKGLRIKKSEVLIEALRFRMRMENPNFSDDVINKAIDSLWENN